MPWPRDPLDGAPEEQAQHLQRFRASHPPSELDIAGVRWEYIACGSGAAAMLLLPGGLRCAESAFPYIELFEPAFRVITPTYPPLQTVEEVVDGAVAVLDAERVPEAFVLGQSYGGMVAQVLVCRHPSRVRKLVLSSSGPLLASPRQARVLRVLLALATRLPERLVMDWWRRSLLAILSVPAAERDFWTTYVRELASQRLTKADVLSHFLTGRDALARYGFDRQSAVPWGGDVLIIGGEKDPVSDAGDRRAMAAFYPRARVQVIPGAGHTVAMTDPAEYAAAVTAFLEEDSGAPLPCPQPGQQDRAH